MAPKTTKVQKSEEGRELRSLLATFSSLDQELKTRISSEDCRTYGLPDLNREKLPTESDADYKKWQDTELKKFIEAKMWYVKNAEKKTILLAPPMLAFIADLFYQRVPQAILWKPRGGGGSLCAAILIWLLMVYKKLSVTDMAGSQEQSRIVYEYTKGFWNCFPELARNLLKGEPLVGETRMTNGVVLKTISATEKQARGKHNPVFVADESCQGQDSTDQMIMAGMQGAMSEPKFCVVLLSTFHHPIGLFQEAWDFAEERGFARYKWDVYDVMEKCTEGLDKATPEDPKAIESFCQKECPLTEKKVILDEQGNQTGWQWSGCNGKARESEGFMPRKNVIIAKKMNRGTNVFEIEFECQRPNWMRPVYDAEWIERALVPSDWPPKGTRIIEKAIGIDWGLEGQTSLVMTALIAPTISREEFVAQRLMSEGPPPLLKHVAILDAEFLTGKLTSEALKVLMSWVEKYGQDNLQVYADASHPFNNLEVENAGFSVNRVLFQKWKDYGIGNCTKYFSMGNRIFINSYLTALIEQLKRYRLDKMGRPVKKDDHGPDALLCAMLNYPFEEKFAEDFEITEAELHGQRHLLPPIPKSVAPMSAGISVPTPQQIVVPGAPPMDPNAAKLKRSKDGQVVVL